MSASFHWQNLNEDERGNPKGWPYHGRAWLHGARVTLRWSWNFWTNFCGASVATGGSEDGLSFFVGFPPIAFWFGIEARPFMRGVDREVSVRVHDSAVWWRVWTDPNSWSRSTPKWRDGNWHPLDTLFGRTEYSKVTLSKHSVLIPMPEGAYAATVEMEECTWKRPRLPWNSTKGRYASVDLPRSGGGIPHEGKGENSWDCGGDALFGLSCEARTIEEAIAKTVEAALRSRRRYDGNVMAKYPAPPVGGGAK